LKGTIQIVLLVSAVLILGESLRIWAGDQAVDSSVILARARKLEELRSDFSGPFTLTGELKAAFGKKKVNGEYKLIWWAPNRWRESLVLGDFQRVREGVNDGYRQVRSLEYQPQVIFDLDKILDVGPMLQIGPRETASKARKRKIDGVELSCVEIHLKSGIDRELCFDPATDLLVHAELQSTGAPGATRPDVEYSGGIALGDKKFPSNATITRGQDFSVEVSNIRLEAISADPSAAPATDPQSSEFWRDCRDSTPAELVDVVSPRFPQESKMRHEQGIVSLYARIEPDGTVSHLRTLGSPSPSLERAAKEAVAQWKYKPRVCGGTPVTDETVIDSVFWFQQ
jgi:TonB family protein